jgi:hypothetical protein
METENALHYMLMVYLDQKPPPRRSGRRPAERHSIQEKLMRSDLEAPSPTRGL